MQRSCKSLGVLAVLSVVFLLAGCAPPPNVPVSKDFWNNHKQKVAVATSTIKSPEYIQQGREGLLDYAINSIATNKFQKHLAHYNVNYIGDIRNQFSSRLAAKEISAKIYAKQIDVKQLLKFNGDKNLYAKRNFMPLKEELNANRLLLVTVNHTGAERSYYGFIPLGAPKALCVLKGRLIDLNNNKILWRFTSAVEMPVEGNWDEPPRYAHFDSSLKEAISAAENELIDNFFIA